MLQLKKIFFVLSIAIVVSGIMLFLVGVGITKFFDDYDVFQFSDDTILSSVFVISLIGIFTIIVGLLAHCTIRTNNRVTFNVILAFLMFILLLQSAIVGLGVFLGTHSSHVLSRIKEKYLDRNAHDSHYRSIDGNNVLDELSEKSYSVTTPSIYTMERKYWWIETNSSKNLFPTKRVPENQRKPLGTKKRELKLGSDRTTGSDNVNSRRSRSKPAIEGLLPDGQKTMGETGLQWIDRSAYRLPDKESPVDISRVEPPDPLTRGGYSAGKMPGEVTPGMQVTEHKWPTVELLRKELPEDESVDMKPLELLEKGPTEKAPVEPPQQIQRTTREPTGFTPKLFYVKRQDLYHRRHECCGWDGPREICKRGETLISCCRNRDVSNGSTCYCSRAHKTGCKQRFAFALELFFFLTVISGAIAVIITIVSIVILILMIKMGMQ